VFPTRRQAPLSPAAVKASAGAVEHLLLCPVDDLAGALADLHAHGVRIVGSEAGAPLTARETDLRGPLAIVVGSEGQGLGPAVRRRCDAFVRIPMRGAIGSLNAAVAGSILLFEAVAQRGGEEGPRRPGESEPGSEVPPTAVEPASQNADESSPPTPGEAAPPAAPAKRSRRARASATAPEASPPAAETTASTDSDVPPRPEADDDALLPDATPAKPTRRRSSSKRA
jgi:23S rRNA (guanosine2251-2'-O)-methyltransferase